MDASNVVVIDCPRGAVRIGEKPSPVIICGPCVIESRDHLLRMAEGIVRETERLSLPLVFKSSYDKANRTSAQSFRGTGRERGLRALEDVRREFGIPVLTDVHSESEVREAAAFVDIVQIPAFLCRQTDILVEAGRSGRPVLIKKGQFVHPGDMVYALEKVRGAGGSHVILCERGACFGYRELVVDFRSLAILADHGVPVVFDATHSVQVMGGSSGQSGGERRFVPLLARAAVAAGVHGVFLECHDSPDKAPSDGANMIPLKDLGPLLEDLKKLGELPLSTRTL